MCASHYERARWRRKHGYTDDVTVTIKPGPPAAGATIDHLCCNKACVNPAHMEIVSREENVRRRWTRQAA